MSTNEQSQPSGDPGRKLTPAMQQYFSVKEQHPDALLLFQMGDFYETFYQDAEDLAAILNITLTARGKDGDDPIPLAGFPMKAMDGYLPRLVAQGKRVVVCDQVGDPKTSKGVVERAITRILTPGTLVEEALLDPARSNYILALTPGKDRHGCAWVELSTGSFQICDCTEDELHILMTRLAPSEMVVSDALKDAARDMVFALEKRFHSGVSLAADWTFSAKQALKALKDHFGVASLAGFGVERDDLVAITSAGALLMYLKEQQRSELPHLARLDLYHFGDSMVLDQATASALEITETLRGHSRKHSLLWALDRCQSAMGSRLLRQWLLAPLQKDALIRMRHAAVEELAYTNRRRQMVIETLSGLNDLERLSGRIGCGRASARDLVALAATLQRVPLLANALAGTESALLAELCQRLDPLPDVVGLIDKAIADEPPQSAKDGGVIRDGFSPELDELRSMQRDGKRYIARFQQQEAEASGISSLKVGYTSVFGYYLEVSNANKDRVPDHWIRKQTLKNAERFITPELKEIETRVLNAESEAQSLETRLFSEVRDALAPYAGRISAVAGVLAHCDVLTGLAEVAASRGWIRPRIVQSGLQIVDGRHPVLEMTLDPGRTVPNDCNLPDQSPMLLVTGPNMAGKSTYIRMVALLTLMAQAGSFVPAQAFEFAPADRIFTRLGSADEIQQGNSTFMVEMVETASILNNATTRSLIVLDEVGRGTSTFDGVSLAWAITEHLAEVVKARTLFATHYHELTQLAALLPSVRNANVSVREWGDDIIFLHKIVEGASDRSYGIHVARLAGVPSDVVKRAKDILARLEKESAGLQSIAASGDGPSLKRPKRVQLTLFTPAEHRVIQSLRDLTVEGVPPEVLRAELTKLKILAESD